MKNKFYQYFLIFIFSCFININAHGADMFNFDVTELEIVEEGNKIIGKHGGTATSEDGTVIKAENFEYDKIENILIAFGGVEIIDKKKNILIKSPKVTYLKNKELVFTNGKSRAISDGIIIDADNFEYNKINNLINANGNVKIDNKDENYLIYSDEATYLKNKELFLTKGKSKTINEGVVIEADNFEYEKINNVINASGNVRIKEIINDYLILTNNATYYRNSEKIVTRGETKADIQSKYFITSKNVTYLNDKKIISSNFKTKIQDQKSQVYFADRFNYSINQ